MSVLQRMCLSQIKGGNLLKALSVQPVRLALFETCHMTRPMTLLSTRQHEAWRKDNLPLMSSNMKPSGCVLCVRSYAKKFKKEKKGGKPGGTKVDLSEEEVGEVIDLEGYRSGLQQVLEHQKEEYIRHLTLRTTIGVFDSIMADTEDGSFPINQLGQVAQKSPHLVMINLSACPQYLPAVKEAIMKSGMNVNPQQEGNTLFVPIPKVTKEHRENLAKSAKTICDTTKDKLRDVHNKYSKKLKQAKSSHPEDLVKNIQTLIINEMHSSSEKAEAMMKAKQQELLGH